MLSLIDCGCGCGCAQTVTTPSPCTSNKCQKTVTSTDLAELIYLMGLDADNCQKLQRLTDVFSLRDCAGNVVASTTPIVTCADFRNRLCLTLSALDVAGEADEFTQLVGADCKLYTLPTSTPGTETPNAAIDSPSVDITLSGTLNRTIRADVNISSDAGNVLVEHSNGLYVPTPSNQTSACAQIQAFPTGSDAVEGTVLIGADCQKHVLAFPSAITVTDTDAIDLTLTGGNLSAELVLDPSSSNILNITGDGLLLTCSDVTDCAPPVTVLDTASVDLTLTGQQIKADVIVSPLGGNALSILPSGLYVDVCSALDDGNPPVPAVIASTALVGADCNRYTIPETPITPLSTSAITLSVSGSFNHTIQANVNVVPNTLITVQPQGLSVTCEAVQDCVFGITNNFWFYDDATNTVLFNPSGDAGNQITTGTDGRPYVPAAALSVVDSNCIDLNLSLGVLTANPIISIQAGNAFQCLADGMFVASSGDVSITGQASNCINVGVSEPTPNNFIITAFPIISLDGGNVLECRANGLYAPSPVATIVGDATDCIDVTVVEAPAGTFTVTADPIIDPDPSNHLICGATGLLVTGVALEGDTCSPSSPQLNGLVLGTDALGAPEWQNPSRTDLAVAAPATLNEINDPTNRDSVFWLSADVTLPTPTDRCSRYDIHLKNIDSVSHTITSADLIDGQGFITLDGTVAGGYPFGNNGGESVHLFYSFSAGTWRVL